MLQVALDRMTREKCFEVVSQIHSNIDYIEIGTGVIKEYGVSIIKEMKEKFPSKMILADMKTCDAGKHETLQALNAGADITTVMGFSANQTIIDSLKVAKELNKEVLIDLLGITCKDRILELKEMGVKAVAVHIGIDMQATTSLDLLNGYHDLLSDFDVFVAGGVNPERIKYFSKVNPKVYIVGSYITGAEKPAEAAIIMQEAIRK